MIPNMRFYIGEVFVCRLATNIKCSKLANTWCHTFILYNDNSANCIEIQENSGFLQLIK